MSDDLEKELRRLQAGPEPPAGLEGQVMAKMSQQGLLPPRIAFPWKIRTTVAVLTACAACFLAGAYLSARRATPPAPPAGARFILFLQGEPAQTPEQEATLVREYSQWAREQRTAGHLVAGEKLKQDALLLRGPTGEAEVESPADEIGGFFVVVAPDLDGALKIARTCPHLRHGGRIIIRPIEPTS